MNASLAFVAAALIAPAPERTVYKLKYVAAVDVARAVTEFAARQKMALTVVPEPVSNAVAVDGRAFPRKLALALLARLDEAPEQVLVNLLVVEVPGGFAEDAGLGEGEKWSLTRRETNMLTAAIRKESGKEILSRPQLMTLNNQTGYVAIGGDDGRTATTDAEGNARPPVRYRTGAITAKVTPQVSPEGAVRVRLETHLAKCEKAVTNVQSVETADEVPGDGALVVRIARSTAADGGARETLLILAAHRVASAER